MRKDTVVATKIKVLTVSINVVTHQFSKKYRAGALIMVVIPCYRTKRGNLWNIVRPIVFKTQCWKRIWTMRSYRERNVAWRASRKYQVWNCFKMLRNCWGDKHVANIYRRRAAWTEYLLEVSAHPFASTIVSTDVEKKCKFILSRCICWVLSWALMTQYKTSSRQLWKRWSHNFTAPGSNQIKNR